MSSVPTTESALRLLRGMPPLYHATSPTEFVARLQQVLAEVLPSADFSLVAVEGDIGLLTHCPRFGGAEHRLSPPELQPSVLRDLLGEPPAERVSFLDGECFIVVEGQELPVCHIWRLGSENDITGYLLFHDEAPQSGFLSDELLEELRSNVAWAFAEQSVHRRNAEQLGFYQAKLETINEVGELLGTLELDVLLAKLMEISLYVVNAQVGSIMLHDDEGTRSGVEWGLPVDMARRFKNRDGKVVYEVVIETGEPALILDFGANSEYAVEGLEVQVGCYLCIPLIAHNRTLGAINLVNPAHEQSHFSELDRDLLMTISGLAATSISNAILHADSLEKERYRQSLCIARDIQGNLYPSAAPTVEGFEVVWSNESCDETGGDYFDFIGALDGAGLTVVVGDVSGHGIGAALLMASARASLRATLTESQDFEFSQVISRLNDQLEQDMELDRFMTLFLAHVDHDREQLAFVNAGHDSPLIYRAEEEIVEELPSTGMPLGIFAGSAFETGTTKMLQSGDVMLITTDGVWEVNDRNGVMLGKDRLKEIFCSYATQPVADLIPSIMKEVHQYTGNVPARDDVTLVAVRAL